MCVKVPGEPGSVATLRSDGGHEGGGWEAAATDPGSHSPGGGAQTEAGATESFTEAETCQVRRGKAEATSMDSASGDELTSAVC